MILIIVESPTKARTLARFLDRKGDYRIEATTGHIRDLPKASLGVDIEHDFAPSYIIPKDKKKRVGQLKALAAKADTIILATDPDREGEAIAWHAANIIHNSKFKIQSLQRIAFHEITQSAINEALAHPRAIDEALVSAQQARRVLDRLVGYTLSPLLWQKLSRRWLSAGRVQSVAVRLLVEREREIAAFAKEEYWTIEGEFQTKSGDPLHAVLISKDSVKFETVRSFHLFDGTYTTATSSIRNHDEAQAIVRNLAPPFSVSAVETKEIVRNPPVPYTTSTLQQDAGRRLGLSAKRTMQLAQQLYEEGLITYHRTDSVNLSDKFIAECRDFILARYGRKYLPATARHYRTKSKLAQEAHEAVRPTDVGIESSQFTRHSREMNRDHIRLYDLIWKRAVACQMKEAVFDSTTISIADNNAYFFQSQGAVIRFDGFLSVLGREANGDIILPPVTVGETLELSAVSPIQHFSAPPPRYSEAALVKTLEEAGIGRPSTYAPIISTIQERMYITKSDKRLLPTDLGFTVTDFLVRFFPDILKLAFTAHMEDEFDQIASGKKDWHPVIRQFYDAFYSNIQKAYESAEKVKIPVETLDEKCPECTNPLVIRTGRYGKFIACSTFPACKYSRQLVEKIGKRCPKCANDIIVKKSRKGKMFYGCAGYPACTFAAWKKEDIV
jgi:DNA topoisomerase-1